MSNDLSITYVPIGELKPAEYNPRTHDDSNTEKLKESIERFGTVDPLIVNCAPGRKNIIIGGHFRYEVLKGLGHTEAPVVYVSIPDPEREKELNLRLNRNTGEWDFEKLKSFDMNLLLDVGFDDSDLSHIWDDALETEEDDFDVEEELEKVGEPKTKPGDLYKLGTHSLLCGDATDPESVKRLVGAERISMIYTDPPYNISLDYSKGISTDGKYGGTTDDKKTPEEYAAFLKKLMENGLSVSKEDVHVFFWCDQNSVGLLQSLYGSLGVRNQRTCLWIKNNINMTPQIAFNKAYESCVYGTRGKPFLSEKLRNIHEVLNKDVGTGNRTIDDILDLLDIWLVRRLPTSEYQHPTSKPPTLHEKPLKRCTKPGDTVLDLCAGSGSPLVACEQLKRRAFLCEVDPVFCDVILKRFEKLTGISPSPITI